MPIKYVVQPGDCISSIAQDNGFHWETLWNWPDNAQLKQTRKDPNILLPGDEVVIPDLRPKDMSVGTETSNKYRIKGVPAKLRLHLLRPKKKTPPKAEGAPPVDPSVYSDPPFTPDQEEEEADANTRYVLDIDGTRTAGTTDGDGRIEVPLPPNARQGKLILHPDTDAERTFALRLGDMDPLQTFSGVRKRLNNLGYPVGPEGDMDSDLEVVLRAFQEHQGLQITGKIDDATRNKLHEVHGC